MICALSGQSAEVPVVSPNSGKVYEKSVIEAWISAKGTDPVTQTPLTASQLIKLDISPVNAELVKSTSIPNLLKALQNEFNGIVLENFDSRRLLDDKDSQLKAAEETIARLEQEKRKLVEQKEATTESDTQTGTKRQRTTDAELGNGSPGTNSSSDPVDLELQEQTGNIYGTVKMSSLEEAMKIHLHDVEGTAKVLSTKRKEVNKYNASHPPTGSPHFREILREEPVGPLRALGSQAFTGDSYICGEVEFAFPAENIFWVNDSLIGRQERDEMLVITKLNSTSVVSRIGTDRQILDAIPHPAGYILVRTESDLRIHSVYKWGRPVEHNMDEHTSLAIHPDGELVFAALAECDEIQTYSFKKMLTGELESIDSLRAHEKNVNMLQASATGYFLAYVWKGVDVGIIDLRYDTPPHVFKDLGTEDSPIVSLAFDETGLRLVVAAGARGIYMLQYAPNNESWSQQHFNIDRVTSVAWLRNEVVALKNIGSLT